MWNTYSLHVSFALSCFVFDMCSNIGCHVVCMYWLQHCSTTFFMPENNCAVSRNSSSMSLLPSVQRLWQFLEHTAATCQCFSWTRLRTSGSLTYLGSFKKKMKAFFTACVAAKAASQKIIDIMQSWAPSLSAILCLSTASEAGSSVLTHWFAHHLSTEWNSYDEWKQRWKWNNWAAVSFFHLLKKMTEFILNIIINKPIYEIKNAEMR